MTSPAGAFVLDASVATQWFLRDEAESALAAQLLEAFLSGSVRLVAPYHVRYEVASALRVATRVIPARLTDAQAAAALQQFLAAATNRDR